ncbi:IS200/IS605 family accessory protein TnpB-related protein, partial [Holdemania filiformis]|uniref:IS200/IS605 family accessory protein TnpB-related protein n=1 Tax=Holdemania filiformis TaxID=61171 RepID=UPI0022E15EAE
GNCVLLKTVPMPLRGKTKNQRKHQIRQTAKEVVLECVRSHKPLVMEALDFEKKKSNMRYGNQKYNRMLSEFTTKQIQETLERRCWKEGYGIYRVNPAYTSQIGREKYSRKMGCTVHMAASFV